MEKQNTSKRIATWAGFIVVLGLIIWGLIAADAKSAHRADLLPLPNVVTSVDHVKGSPTAPVTLVEYGDFQCPACGEFYPIVEKLLTEVGSTTVRLVFRHFPLSQHQNAIPAALVSEAAGNQGKFWEMYDILYQNQDQWSESTSTASIFEGYATKLGLDMDKYKADIASKSASDIVESDRESGVAAKLQGTPSFFVNGKQIANPQSYDEFKKIINDAQATTTTS